MKDALISQYVNRLSPNDISDFAQKYGIILNDNELQIIYNHIKNNWRTIVYGNPKPILEDIKNKFDSTTYHKIEELYVQFKNKYENQL